MSAIGQVVQQRTRMVAAGVSGPYHVVQRTAHLPCVVRNGTQAIRAFSIRPTLLHQVDLFSGVTTEGLILINSTRSFAELGIGEFVEGFHPDLLCTVPATELALKHVGRPLPNAALLGGFAAVCDQVRLESVFAAIREKFAGKVAEGNVAAAREAFEIVMKEREEARHA